MTGFEDFQLKISGQNYVILRTVFVEPVTCVNIAIYYKYCCLYNSLLNNTAGVNQLQKEWPLIL